MIVTVTPNPSLDRAYDLARLGVGEINRALRTHVDAGGKGINVSRVLRRHDVATVAVLPSGGADGHELLAALREQDVPVHAVPVAGETRSNITLVEHDGTTTKINAPGPALDAEGVRDLLAAVGTELTSSTDQRAGLVAPTPSTAERAGLAASVHAAPPTGHPRPVVVGAGSLPDGTDPEFYVRLARVAAEHGADIALDTSGEPFVRAVRAGGLALIKPNDEELAELVGRPLATVGDVVVAAREVISQGTREVLVSLGSHGVLLVTADEWSWAGGPALVPLSTVGAGDATLAGYLSVPSGGLDALRAAAAWGRAAVLLPGSAAPEPHHLDHDAVRVVDRPDTHLALKEL